MSSKTAGRFCVLELTLATARRVSGTERGLVSSCSASGLSFLPDRRMVCAWVAALRMALKLLASITFSPWISSSCTTFGEGSGELEPMKKLTAPLALN
jgi:hypothetical protein